MEHCSPYGLFESVLVTVIYYFLSLLNHFQLRQAVEVTLKKLKH